MCEEFQIAVRRAIERFGQTAWDHLSMHDQSAAIYQELRALDAERAAREGEEKPPAP